MKKLTQFGSVKFYLYQRVSDLLCEELATHF